MSGSSASAAATPVSPSLAVPTTAKPSFSSTTCAIARNDGWSSTINTVTGSRAAMGRSSHRWPPRGSTVATTRADVGPYQAHCERSAIRLLRSADASPPHGGSPAAQSDRIIGRPHGGSSGAVREAKLQAWTRLPLLASGFGATVEQDVGCAGC